MLDSFAAVPAVVAQSETDRGREEVSLSPVPGACLTDPSTQVCEYDEASYPHSFVSSVLHTYSAEMRLLLNYVKPAMIVSPSAEIPCPEKTNFSSNSLTTTREMLVMEELEEIVEVELEVEATSCAPPGPEYRGLAG